MNYKQINLENSRSYIDKLDLHYIVESMCSQKYSMPRWEMQDAIHCLKLYKNFLFLQKKHFPEKLVPSREIDEFWHNHILYTRNYLQDCLNIFGHYLHHEPVSSNEDSQQLINDYLKTKQYYFDEFGTTLELIIKK